MERSELHTGRLYALRERRAKGTLLVKVRLLEHVGKGKVRIRLEEGRHHDLQTYASTHQLVAAWAERRAFLRDEEQAAQLEAHAATVADKAIATAVAAVLESTGEQAVCVREHASSMSGAQLGRICDRAGISAVPATLHPLGFTDRRGYVHLPLDGMLRLARAFAEAEPEAVSRYITAREHQLRARGDVPGDHWWHSYLCGQAPGFALARQWAGTETENKLLRREIARLRTLLARVEYELHAAGLTSESRRVARALRGV